ncbi:hypothetical protein K437DRAFT_113641 [Tilletiaria anomala UBC 951]|uniref:Pre-rRNA-processing protein TSR2 n=1 Tax=Tilletiaria anomala (strain ATCC 24038 / CBS 436.72 / UBC 951) TaxID=1037660 RepID=A0A066VWR3_TILAU|nr:uncharacterized protein K437DRAFT_113641 [Tilletiaria anomala UBC 951]KDN45896.1 hypothetical protein K437DRAFT_113641 [Tilletiaria anomala UBC 951]
MPSLSYSNIAASLSTAPAPPAQAHANTNHVQDAAVAPSTIQSNYSLLEPVPSPQQLQFARAVILTLDLWPAMRLAVDEEWGGPESRDKAEYLASAVCDMCDESAAALAANPSAGAQAAPDEDDLEEVLESYVSYEFNVRLEDGSVQYVAKRLVALWKTIFLEGPGAGGAALQDLEEAYTKLRGSKVAAQRQAQDQDLESDSDSEDGSETGEANGHQPPAEKIAGEMDVDDAPLIQPNIDEDGFMLVRSNRKNR